MQDPAGPPNETRSSKPVDKGITKERQRVSRACDFCKEKKIRCNGKQPCANCVGLSSTCTYKTPYLRGRRRRKGNRDNETTPTQPIFRGQMQMTTTCDGDSAEAPPAMSFDTGPYSDLTEISSRAFNEDTESRNSPELAASNEQGHIVGSASGLNFLLRLQRRLRPNAGVSLGSSIDTFGDAPLPPFDDLSFMLPVKSEADALLTTYFDLASPTYRFLHRQTVEGWLEVMYNDLSTSDNLSSCQRAVLLTAFAQATKYISSTSSGTNAASGMKYFQAAERLLTRSNTLPDLTTCQALLGCCFYILSCSRLNHCWSLFGTTSRLVVALGLHRKVSNQQQRDETPLNYIDIECRKRLFWCSYNLDKYLSAIMGRPSVFHDEDIDQESPSIVEDSSITPYSINLDRSGSYCTMIGPDMHVRLGRILSRTLRKLYGITPLSKDAKYTVMSKLGDEMEAWKEQLPPFLNPDKVDSRVLSPLFHRQSNLLSMAYSHVIILIFRSCLFERQVSLSESTSTFTKTNIERCRSVALIITDTVDRMVEAHQLYAGSWFTHYHAFCAVIILYTYTLRHRTHHPDTWLQTFRSAERCQGWISAIGGPETLAFRFCLVMQEYRLEVLRQLQIHSPFIGILTAENLFGDAMQANASLADSADTGVLQDGSRPYGDMENDAASNSIDLADFEQLYSLVSAFAYQQVGIGRS